MAVVALTELGHGVDLAAAGPVVAHTVEHLPPEYNRARIAQGLDIVLRHYRPLGGLISPKDECFRLIEGKGPEVVQVALDGMPSEWADHAIASAYAVLMPHSRRKALGIYFTPPHLVRHLLWRMTTLGLDISRQCIRDPAAGGAAFLVPLARRMVAAWRAEGLTNGAVLTMLRRRLVGLEIDRDLAEIANALVRRMLVREYRFRPSAVRGLAVVRIEDALSRRFGDPPEHEVGNPPYRRLSADEHAAMRERFGDIASGRLNLYAMFIRRAITEVPLGGLVGHIVPASFLGGSEFAAFRRRMLELADVLVVDLIDQRSQVFLDATQDACFIVLRRRAAEVRGQDGWASSGLLRADGRFTPIGKIRLGGDGSPWHLVGGDGPSGVTLAEWGYRALVGYLVAYRQTERMHVAPGEGRVPLIWAKAIRPDGTFDHAHGVSAKRPGWVSAPTDARYVVRDPCVVVQRTSSRDQKRRITAAAVPQAFLERHGGIIAENHVLILVRSHSHAPPPEALAKVLNDPKVGQALDRVCGSASIPLRLLEVLRLPPPMNRDC